MTLAKAEVCGRVRLSIGPVSGVVFTLGDGWSTVWGGFGPCVFMQKSGKVRRCPCMKCQFGPSLDGLVEHLYRGKLIVACNGRGFV